MLHREGEQMEIQTIGGLVDFNLDHTFDCGQCFRWEKEADGSYTGVAFNRVVNMRLENETADKKKLVISPCSYGELTEIWKPYLDLDRDYGAIKAKLSAEDPVMAQATEYGWGIRILRQELWETIVSFIISQNNNIPRIKGCIEGLANLFGEQIEGEALVRDASGPLVRGRARSALPGAEKLASLAVEDLAPVRLGYRAKYLIETARQVVERGLPQTIEELSALCGVGPKVASCISLFALGNYDSFPIDVWMARVMHQLYGIDEKDKKSMQEYAHAHFGDLGGFAQQYLFYYIRGIEK